jgi:hypothetical protein
MPQFAGVRAVHAHTIEGVGEVHTSAEKPRVSERCPHTTVKGSGEVRAALERSRKWLGYGRDPSEI